MSEDVEISGRDTVYRGFFRIDKFTLRHRLYRGGWSAAMSREVFERGQTVGVLLYDPVRDAVVLIEQFRLPSHLMGLPGWQIEIVAGIVNADEEPDAAVATREAREETGLEIEGALVPMHRFMPSPGGSTETFDLYCGKVDANRAGGIHGVAEEHEDIKVVVLSYRAAMRRLRGDQIKSGPAVVALYWLAANRARLRRAWPAA